MENNTVTQSADKAVEESEEVFSQMINLLELRQEGRSCQEKEVSCIKKLCEKLQRDIAELKKKDGILRWISDTTNHKQFLDQFSSLPLLGNRTETPEVRLRPSPHFTKVIEALSALHPIPSHLNCTIHTARLLNFNHFCNSSQVRAVD